MMPNYDLGGGNSTIFFIFTPKLGEDEPILTCAYFSKGLKLNHQLVMTMDPSNQKGEGYHAL